MSEAETASAELTSALEPVLADIQARTRAAHGAARFYTIAFTVALLVGGAGAFGRWVIPSPDRAKLTKVGSLLHTSRASAERVHALLGRNLGNLNGVIETIRKTKNPNSTLRAVSFILVEVKNANDEALDIASEQALSDETVDGIIDMDGEELTLRLAVVALTIVLGQMFFSMSKYTRQHVVRLEARLDSLRMMSGAKGEDRKALWLALAEGVKDVDPGFGPEGKASKALGTIAEKLKEIAGTGRAQ